MYTIQKRKPNSYFPSDLISKYPAVDAPFQRAGQNRCHQQHRQSKLVFHHLLKGRKNSLGSCVRVYRIPSESNPSKIREDVYLFQPSRFQELLNLFPTITSFHRGGKPVELVVNTNTKR